MFFVGMKILVTGGAGFIGAHTAKMLCDRGHSVVIVDDFNDYYSVQLKEDRIVTLLRGYAIEIERIDIRNVTALELLFQRNNFDAVCHLAARAGVRSSLENPGLYYDVNVMGTLNIFECARKFGVSRVVFASSSSVYGNNTKLPFSEEDFVDHPISPYAATKKSCELMAYHYHNLHAMNVIGLRFFTVYGPWGRPDMALFKFTDAIVHDRPIDVYNHGKMLRDFTYVNDIVRGTVGALEYDGGGYHILNLGNNHVQELGDFITVLERTLGKISQKNYLPMQPGDVSATYADIAKARMLLGFESETNIEQGIPKFIEWYKEYYRL